MFFLKKKTKQETNEQRKPTPKSTKKPHKLAKITLQPVSGNELYMTQNPGTIRRGS